MNEFKLLLKRDGWIIVNHFREIKQNPKRLVVYFLYLIWIGSLVFNVVLGNRNPGKIHLQLGPQIMGAGFAGFGIALIFYYLYHGTKESSTFFTMGDVHLLFPAPVSPKRVLLYSMLKQTLLYFFLYGFVILAFMPLMMQLAKINLLYFPLMYCGFIGLLLVIGPLNFLVFVLGSKYGIQLRIQQGIQALTVIIFIYLAAMIISAGDLVQGLLLGLNAPFLEYLPVIGWCKAVFMTAITGYSTYSAIALALQLLFIICCIVLSYRVADDYYEDILTATEKRSLRKRRKEGSEKSRQFSLPFSKRQHAGVRSIGSGPWVFFWRSRVEYSKNDLHPFLGLWTLLYLLAGIAVGFYGSKYAAGLTPLYIANGAIAYIIFIFSATNAAQHELTKPYIYLIPGSSLLKIISSNLTDVVRMSFNILALNISLGILLPAPLHVIIVMVVFVISFYILNLSSNFLTRVLFPNAVDQKVLYPLFLMLQILLLLVPGIITGGILAFIYRDILLSCLGISIVNIIIIGILLLLSNAVFARLEWK